LLSNLVKGVVNFGVSWQEDVGTYIGFAGRYQDKAFRFSNAEHEGFDFELRAAADD
jgi:hypothetical protein